MPERIKNPLASLETASKRQATLRLTDETIIIKGFAAARRDGTVNHPTAVS
jgi:hypothetical protein